MPYPVLICDDEKDIRFGLAHVFDKEGYISIQAEDGFHCLDLIEKQPFSLIILDLKMPGMDGLTVLRKLSEKNIKTPVMVITGHGDVDSAIKCTQYGAVSFVQKPFDFKEILVRGELHINEYLRSLNKIKINHAPGSHQFILPENGINLTQLQASLIDQAMKRTNGNKSKAAKLLGISRDSIRYQLSK
jgi:DNA-binding NtrC family response regulator